MKQNITERVTVLRSLLSEKGLSAFIIPSTDPHLSEYVASHWKSREWISGFTGSAGTVVVTLDKAGLWTDSRYFLQAADQLENTGIELFKDGLPTTPTIMEWLSDELKEGESLGLDGKMFSVSEVEDMKNVFSKKSITVDTSLDPFEQIWSDRPAMPQDPAFIYETKYAGVSCTDKIEQIRQKMENAGVESLLVSTLDEIAWTLNLRGCDVKCNPVVISYLLISKTEIVYFIAPEKLTKEVREYLLSQNVVIRNYDEINNALSELNTTTLLINPSRTNFDVCSAVNPLCKVVRGNSPIALLKAIRNEQEITGIRSAMIRDGVALTKFLRWLEAAVPKGTETELSIDAKLHEFRAAQDMYMGESFDTIAGYKEHGAIVHYSATAETSSVLKPEGFLLLDSGAQYLDGTTDITRTIALGPLTEEEKIDYTLVLKGHIALATCKFPYGTRGSQIDVLARAALWQRGLNYLHGTGHGVGHFLSVHEGPQSIRMNENPVLLLPGMLTSNEPGLYKGGRHGIRTENLTLVRRDVETEFGEFYRFETVTLCPICTEGIIKSLLSDLEVNWLNDYHKIVFDRLSPYLDAEEISWLRTKTVAI
ncbi:aminopeptidase P family protein [uncultured Bacteroides sp.]|uniref:aminopeptidase P family protein n=1 Tax=uncultured Bacteroides sp. TaxID=162156 RepID=UPI002AA93294|nr:aminopeptidase P family protein [uncultured Bacteroides sp.]